MLLLSRGATLILDGVFETDVLSLRIEGLQRVAGSSGIGNFHYLPCVTQEGDQAYDVRRVVLEVAGLVLSGLQGRAPSGGIIWRGDKEILNSAALSGLKRGRTHRSVRQAKLGASQSGESPAGVRAVAETALSSECCGAAGDDGREAYTAIMWSGILSLAKSLISQRPRRRLRTSKAICCAPLCKV